MYLKRKENVSKPLGRFRLYSYATEDLQSLHMQKDETKLETNSRVSIFSDGRQRVFLLFRQFRALGLLLSSAGNRAASDDF